MLLVSWCPVSRLLLSSPLWGSYAAMCSMCRFDIFSIASSMYLSTDWHLSTVSTHSNIGHTWFPRVISFVQSSSLYALQPRSSRQEPVSGRKKRQPRNPQRRGAADISPSTDDRPPGYPRRDQLGIPTVVTSRSANMKPRDAMKPATNLGRHNLGIGTSDLHSGVHACLVMSLDDVPPENFIAADTAVVWP